VQRECTCQLPTRATLRLSVLYRDGVALLQIACVRELLEVEERCKWALVTLHRLLTALAAATGDGQEVSPAVPEQV
jgi:hypothetical protein